jgi:hypothetical protein
MKNNKIKAKARIHAMDRVEWVGRAMRARINLADGSYMPIFTREFPEYIGRESEVRQVLNGRLSKHNYKDIVTKAESLVNSKKPN